MTALLFDGIVFALQTQGGIGRYFREIAVRHINREPASKLVVYGGTNELDNIAAASVQRRAPRLLERYRRCHVPEGSSVFHSSYYRLPYGKLPVVTTVHDFIYEKFRMGVARVVPSHR